MHPATEQILRYFAYEHLPAHLQEVSRPFAELAEQCAARLDGPGGRLIKQKTGRPHAPLFRGGRGRPVSHVWNYTGGWNPGNQPGSSR